MGFKSVSRPNNEDLYIINGIGYSSRHEFTTIESINRNLKFITPDSPIREDEEEFDCFLDRVEERIGRLNQKIRVVEINGYFEEEFSFIFNFLDEANSLPENNNNHFIKRFIYLSKRMKEKGF